MRKTQRDSMTETVYVQRLMATPDGAGGWTHVWNTVATVKGRVGKPESAVEYSAEGIRAGEIAGMRRYVITLPYDTDVTESDMLQVAMRQFEVVSISRPSSPTALRVYCIEV